MPQAIISMATGYYQNTVYIIGSYGYPQGLMQYHINNNTFSYNETYFPKQLTGVNTQWFVQINNTVYMTVDNGYNYPSRPDTTMPATIYTFNLITKKFDDFAIPKYIQARNIDACLAGHKNKLLLYYILNSVYDSDTGTEYVNTVQIYNISNQSWSLAAYAMNLGRGWYSCIVSNDKLYAIGGIAGDPRIIRTPTIEYVSIIGIEDNHWSYTPKNLTLSLYRVRSVTQGYNIFVIGGSFDTHREEVYLFMIEQIEYMLSIQSPTM